MTESGPDEALAEAFEEQRGRLVAVAYRMLGSRADAEDAVQEAWLRLARHDAAAIDNLGGWLTTVVGRVCIDVPPERLAFVLHDMFAVPFEEIGQIIGRSPDAAKMLASRARRKVQDTPRPTDERQQQRAVVDAFLAAARSGDFEGLLRVLDPDVTWRSYTARGVVIRLGAAEVADRAQRGARATVTARPVLVNGEPGVVVWDRNGKPVSVMACTVIDDRIVEILSIQDPERLAAMDLPARPD
jgi:RNA polymerase sigma-70 factor (ECF subfamily)